jgi:hypothetical protein
MPGRSAWGLRSLLVVLAAPASLTAQQDPGADPKVTATSQVLDGKLVDRLPVDRIRDALVLLPGVGVGETAGISIRGGRPGDAATYLDGVPVSPGFRKQSRVFDRDHIPAPGQSFLDLGTNSFSSLEAMTGPLSP